MRADWSHYVDSLRDDSGRITRRFALWIFDFYDVSVFNQCVKTATAYSWPSRTGGMCIRSLKILPVDWGLFHSIRAAAFARAIPDGRALLFAVEKVIANRRAAGL